jgi:uncharacterized protein with gpF-like domain
MWATQGDKRVRQSHEKIDGQVRKDGEPFPNGLRYPRDPAGPPEETKKCRCTLDKYRG